MNSKETGWTNSGALPSVETWCAARDATGSRLVFGAGTEKTHTAASSGSGQSFAPGCCLAALLPLFTALPSPPPPRTRSWQPRRQSLWSWRTATQSPPPLAEQPAAAPSGCQRRQIRAAAVEPASLGWASPPHLPLLRSEGLRTHHQPPSPPPWTRRSA